MNRSALFFLLTAAGSFSLAVRLLSQQPAAAPAPRPATPPYTSAELNAIPIVPPRAGTTVRKALFDGKSLQGWKGNLDWWSVQDAAIVGKFNSAVPTSFLFTDDNYSDFRLTLSSKMVESENHAGVCFWGEIAQQRENKWYTHGPLVIFPNPGMWDYNEAKGLRVFRPTTEKVTQQHEWVKVEILAQGNRVRTAMNGVEVMEWREGDPSRIRAGPVGLQLHAWKEAQQVLYKDVEIETFPKDGNLITVAR